MLEAEKTRIDEIKESVSEAESESVGFMEPGTKVRKKRGPYKKRAKKENSEKDNLKSDTTQQDEGPKIETSQILRPAFQVIGNAAERWADDKRANLTENEMAIFCDVTGKLFDKYLPNMFEKYALEATAIFMVATYSYRVLSLKRARDIEKGANQPIGNSNLAPFNPGSQNSVDESSKSSLN